MELNYYNGLENLSCNFLIPNDNIQIIVVHIDEQENEMNKEENVSDINELITDYSLEEDDIFTETPSSKKMIRT